MSMQRWQQRQRQRIHDSRIQNVKSTFQRQSKSRQKNALSSSRSKLTVQTTFKPTLPFLRILQIFQLEQYSNLLHFYGFPAKLVKKSGLQDIDEMLNKVQTQDRQRFMSLLNTLALMSKSMHNKNQQKFKKTSENNNNKRNSLLNRSQKTHLPPSSSKISTVQKTQKQGLGIGGGNSQNNSKFRIKNSKLTPNIKPHHDSIQRRPTQKKKVNTPIIKPFIDTKRVYSMMMDDSNITHNYRKNKKGQVNLIQNSNALVKKLYNKLKQQNQHHHGQNHSHNNKGQKPNSYQDIQLQVKKIKDMYLSYDSGTLTSNITNIDIEEMIDCFALEVIDLIKKTEIFLQQKCLVNSNKHQIEKLLKESFVAVKEESGDSSKHNTKQKFEIFVQNQGKNKTRKKSQFQSSKRLKKKSELSQPQQQLQYQHQQSVPQCQLQEFETFQRPKAPLHHTQQAQSISIQQQQNKTNSVQSDDSDSFQHMNYYNSFVSDFSCFDSRFQQSIYSHKPTKQDVKNFIQLVLMAGKMQKQIPILGHVYLKRLLKNVKGGRLTYSNWRNIILVVLIQGSKIWDDQSLQNNSFAKVIKPYTTLQINRLQKYLLAFIDYTLKVDQKQYSQSYFELRRHIGQANKTANLVKLDLKTIKRLQNGAKKNQNKLQQFYSKCMNKSF